jgi:hypothetical protein
MCQGFGTKCKSTSVEEKESNDQTRGVGVGGVTLGDEMVSPK